MNNKQVFRLALSAMATLAFCGSVQAAPVSVEESVQLAAKPAEVWKVIGDFAGLPSWHPAVAKTTITRGYNNHKGAVRTIETKDGAKLVEELLTIKSGKSMQYRIIESPLPVSGYVSTLSVQPAGAGSKVIWKSTFEATKADGMTDDKAKGIVAGIYTAGFEGLQAKLAKAK